MKQAQFKKLLITSLAVVILVFSASICAYAAQIESLSIIDNTIYASVDAENANLFAAEYDEGLLSDVFFTPIPEDGIVELEVSEASDYVLYLWDKGSLAPVSAVYNVIDGVAYMEGSSEPVPPYKANSYTFNQEDDVMIVSAVSETEIKGFKAGVETTYALTDDVAVLGLSDSFEDVVPGSVVLIGTDKSGKCAAVELLASLGLPVDREAFEADYGIYDAADASTKYKNIVDVMFSKSSSVMTLRALGGQKYIFKSNNIPCYRVGIAMDGDTPVITYTVKPVSEPKDTSVFANTATHYNYVYLRLNTEESRTLSGTTYDAVVTQCVLYCVPKDFNPGKGDGEYSDIFNLEPIVIIE